MEEDLTQNSLMDFRQCKTPCFCQQCREEQNMWLESHQMYREGLWSSGPFASARAFCFMEEGRDLVANMAVEDITVFEPDSSKQTLLRMLVLDETL